MERVETTTHGHVFEITLNRAEKHNAFDLAMLNELSIAMTTFEEDDSLRCALLTANGDHFTAGLDLGEVGPAVKNGAPLFPKGSVDPLSLHGRARTKPLLMAVQGWCLTIGIELLLAADVRLAAEGTRFGQIEICRGIFPFGGATIRLPQVAGWGNAMKWLLTGDIFDAAEAHRIGLVQEVTTPESLRPRALELAQTIAKRAPLGVQATLASSRTTMLEGEAAAREHLLAQARSLMETDDAAEGLRSFLERREAVFTGQ